MSMMVRSALALPSMLASHVSCCRLVLEPGHAVCDDVGIWPPKPNVWLPLLIPPSPWLRRSPEVHHVNPVHEVGDDVRCARAAFSYGVEHECIGVRSARQSIRTGRADEDIFASTAILCVGTGTAIQCASSPARPERTFAAEEPVRRSFQPEPVRFSRGANAFS